jgi:hypothetical protein
MARGSAPGKISERLPDVTLLETRNPSPGYRIECVAGKDPNMIRVTTTSLRDHSLLAADGELGCIRGGLQLDTTQTA